LRNEVVQAVRDGKFNVYAVEHADQAISLLTGISAGAADEAGVFPEDSVNGRVQAALQNLAALRLQYAAAAREGAATPGGKEQGEQHGFNTED
jgi:hypothetical protein